METELDGLHGAACEPPPSLISLSNLPPHLRTVELPRCLQHPPTSPTASSAWPSWPNSATPANARQRHSASPSVSLPPPATPATTTTHARGTYASETVILPRKGIRHLPSPPGYLPARQPARTAYARRARPRPRPPTPTTADAIFRDAGVALASVGRTRMKRRGRRMRKGETPSPRG